MRVKAFLRAGNSAGREISVGGRRASDSVWAELNTDNAIESDVSVKVTAIGGIKSVFSIKLPDPSEHVEIYINGRRWEGDGK